MRLCTCCRTPVYIDGCRNVRPMVYDFMYALLAECPACHSTLAFVLWELPE